MTENFNDIFAISHIYDDSATSNTKQLYLSCEYEDNLSVISIKLKTFITQPFKTVF